MSAVEFNFRILRTDRKPMSPREVYAVLRFFIEYRREPDGYVLTAVNWRSPKANQRRKHWRYPSGDAEGRDVLLDHFWAILKTEGIEAVRAGLVKANRL